MEMAKVKIEKISGYPRPTYLVATRYGDTYEYQQFVPEGRKPARTIRGALVNTLDVLQDEEHYWMKHDWFKNSNPNLDPEDAFCNSWGACLEGIIGIVTTGAYRNTSFGGYRWHFDGVAPSSAPNHDLYKATVAHVIATTEQVGRGFPSIPDFNDDKFTTRTDVVKLVKRAIRSAPKSAK